MKEASGELNMTVITIVAIAVIGVIGVAIYSAIGDNVKKASNCASITNESDCGTAKCTWVDGTGTASSTGVCK